MNMRSLGFSLLGMVLFAGVAAGQPVLTSEDLLALTTHEGRLRWPTFQRAGSLAWSPDGKSLIYARTDRRGGTDPALMRLNLESGATSQFAEGSFAVFAPDGKQVVLGKSRDLRVAELGANGVRRVIAHIAIDPTSTYPLMGASTVAWSPDSTQLAFVTVTQAEHSGYGTPETRFPNGFELRILDVRSNKQKILYRSGGHDSAVGSVAWESADRLLVSLGYDGTGPADRSAQVALLDVRTKAITPLIQGAGFIAAQLHPALSPDKRMVSFERDFDLKPPVQMGTTVAIRAMGSTETRRLDAEVPVMSSAVWTPDGKALLFLCRTGALTASLCKVSAPDAALLDVRNFDPLENIQSFALAQDGRRLAWRSRDVYEVERVRILDLETGAQRLAFEDVLIDPALKAFGGVQELRWRSFDGEEIRGLLVKPVGYVRGQRYPLIVDVHGGPNGGIPLSGVLVNTNALEWQMWAGLGYAVLVTDYRGSGLYAGNNRLSRRPADRALYDADVADIVSGTRFLVDSGIADRAKLVAVGHSHGSTLVNWLATRTTCFAGIVTKEGRSDWRRMPEGWGPFYEWYFNTTAERLAHVMYENSAVRYASQVRSPLLYLTGQYGLGAQEAAEFVDAINRAGGSAQALSFGNEGHNVESAEHIRTMLDTTLAFVQTALSRHAVDRTSHRCSVEEVLAPRSGPLIGSVAVDF